MPANPLRYKHFAVALTLVGVLGAGCIFSPDRGDGPPPKTTPYSIRNTPIGAIYYLQQAWSNRDSVRIDSVYATDYQGTSQDLTDLNNPTTLTFYKSDEVRSVARLARSPTVSVSMNFFSYTDWVTSRYVSDPPEWVSFQIQIFTIYLNDTSVIDGEYEARSPKSGFVWFFEFTLRPTYPNGPTADPVWEIVRWKEVRDKN